MLLARNAASSIGVHGSDFLNMLVSYLAAPCLARLHWHTRALLVAFQRRGAGFGRFLFGFLAEFGAYRLIGILVLLALASLSHFFFGGVLHQRLLLRLILGGRLRIGLGAKIENSFYLTRPKLSLLKGSLASTSCGIRTAAPIQRIGSIFIAVS